MNYIHFLNNCWMDIQYIVAAAEPKAKVTDLDILH